jgi:hypothetical protein
MTIAAIGAVRSEQPRRPRRSSFSSSSASALKGSPPAGQGQHPEPDAPMMPKRGLALLDRSTLIHSANWTRPGAMCMELCLGFSCLDKPCALALDSATLLGWHPIGRETASGAKTDRPSSPEPSRRWVRVLRGVPCLSISVFVVSSTNVGIIDPKTFGITAPSRRAVFSASSSAVHRHSE